MSKHLSQDELTGILDKAKESVAIGAEYEHYKGQKYKVVDIAMTEENNASAVIYEALYGNHIRFIRPLDNWLETVEIDERTVPRFRKTIDAYISLMTSIWAPRLLRRSARSS